MSSHATKDDAGFAPGEPPEQMVGALRDCLRRNDLAGAQAGFADLSERLLRLVDHKARVYFDRQPDPDQRLAPRRRRCGGHRRSHDPFAPRRLPARRSPFRNRPPRSAGRPRAMERTAASRRRRARPDRATFTKRAQRHKALASRKERECCRCAYSLMCSRDTSNIGEL